MAVATMSVQAAGGGATDVYTGDFARIEQRALVLSLGLAPDLAWLCMIITADPRWA